MHCPLIFNSFASIPYTPSSHVRRYVYSLLLHFRCVVSFPLTLTPHRCAKPANHSTMQTPKTKMLHLSRDRLTYSFHFLCENKHLVWVPCAAVSLTTSKYLLVDASLHYPLHLQLLQHAAALLLLLLWRTFRSDEYSTGTEPLEDFQWASQLCVSFLLAVAGGCTMQAVLHLPNITLIAMLAVSLTILFNFVANLCSPYLSWSSN